MKKADELWDKHLHNDMYATKAGFLAALQEYGGLVKAEAVKVCDKKALKARMPTMVSAFHDCAAAIEEMKLP